MNLGLRSLAFASVLVPSVGVTLDQMLSPLPGAELLAPPPTIPAPRMQWVSAGALRGDQGARSGWSFGGGCCSLLPEIITEEDF